MILSISVIIFLCFLLSSSFFLMHNFKTIRLLRTIYVPNKCSAIVADVPFWVRAACELRLVSLWPQTHTKVIFWYALLCMFQIQTKTMHAWSLPGLYHIVGASGSRWGYAQKQKVMLLFNCWTWYDYITWSLLQKHLYLGMGSYTQ